MNIRLYGSQTGEDSLNVWTIYCEAAGSLHPVNSNAHRAANATALEFWLKIAPTIANFLSVSEDAAAVNGHLLTVLEELKECRSVIVDKLITMWVPILSGKQKQANKRLKSKKQLIQSSLAWNTQHNLPGNILKRLQKCVEWEPPELESRLHVLLRSASVLTQGSRSGNDAGSGISGGAAGNDSSPYLSSVRGVDVNLCSANSLNGCNHTEGACAGHSLAPVGSSSNRDGGTGSALSEGCGCAAVGSAGFLSNRLVRWLKKQIFVLGRNEDQHSTATHIFIH
ncbi:hypothetical protein ACTXT7_004566 [Hymenolepis weldensis]